MIKEVQDLIEQVELNEFRDELGHKLTMNQAYINLKELVHMEKELHDILKGIGYFDVEGRGFKPVPGMFVKSHNSVFDVVLPKRGTKKSAGYDFVSPRTVIIDSGAQVLIWTDVCAYMEDDEVLNLHVRSSVGIKRNLILANTTGIVDADYYANPDNFGNIGICLRNTGKEKVIIKEGERIAQGIFTKYLVTNDDQADGERGGGIGSTGK